MVGYIPNHEMDNWFGPGIRIVCPLDQVYELKETFYNGFNDTIVNWLAERGLVTNNPPKDLRKEENWVRSCYIPSKNEVFVQIPFGHEETAMLFKLTFGGH